MAATTSSGTPVPTLGDVPNVPADMLRMATYLEPITTPRFSSDANASLGLPGRVVGQGALINGIRKVWNGSLWVPSDAPIPLQGANMTAFIGSVPANTQLRTVGGMFVPLTNGSGHTNQPTGFTVCILTAWATNGDPTSDVIGAVDAPFSTVGNLVVRWKARATGAYISSGPVRCVWGAIGI